MLELNGMEIGHFSISCRFKNVRDGFCWEALERFLGRVRDH